MPTLARSLHLGVEDQIADRYGRRTAVRGDHATFRADTTSGSDAAGIGPHRLDSADRDLLALTA